MSRRAIRRYDEALRAQKIHEEKENEGTDSDTAPESHHPISKPSPGFFSLLQDSEDLADEDEDKDEDEPTAEYDVPIGEETTPNDPTDHIQEAENAPNISSIENQKASLGESNQGLKKSKKKRKKGRGKKKRGNVLSREEDPDWIALNEASDLRPISSRKSPSDIPKSYFRKEDDDEIRKEASEIMKTVEKMALSDSDGISGQNFAVHEDNNPLRVEVKHLNASSELKKLFGSRAVEAERRNERNADAQVLRRRRPPPPRAHLRKQLTLVTPRDTWFGYAPGLTMVIDKEPTNNSNLGLRYFRYKHEPSYKSLQNEYRVVVENLDHNPLVQFVSMHPFHVDGLLQLAELYRQMGEMDRAAEQIERSIYVLQTSWNVTFKPYDGMCRLRFDVIENRSLYLALFRYSQLLTRRGLHRTALEVSKLLLNFDPVNDPMGVLLLADSYALLSGEYGWILGMNKFYKHVPLKYFPNFAASAAIAIESERQDSFQSSTLSTSRKGVSGTQSKESETELESTTLRAEETLIDALLTYPMLLKPIVLAIRDDPGVWAEYTLYDENWYSSGIENCDVLLRISRIYAERSKLLWNSVSHKEMLAKCARIAGELDRLAAVTANQTKESEPEAYRMLERVVACRALRKDAAEWFEKSGLYRTLQIGDFTDSSNLPGELLARDAAQQAIGAHPQRDITLTQGAIEFLQSMLPWREARDAHPEAG
ncbi:unnamed protein product [Agarophyton chilense]|eukprot:gb/GEZJ01003790.1/.p1 GENE.gb/GEZJ01003790.1/~~gb/GEZJ01003790.1/.p1  ORF type:complete len:710 (+),score=107.15 gb/GEZJ01003790.1/:381-2510(+)